MTMHRPDRKTSRQILMLIILTAVSTSAAVYSVGLHPAPFQIGAAAFCAFALACQIVLWVKSRRNEDAVALFTNRLQQIARPTTGE